MGCMVSRRRLSLARVSVRLSVIIIVNSHFAVYGLARRPFNRPSFSWDRRAEKILFGLDDIQMSLKEGSTFSIWLASETSLFVTLRVSSHIIHCFLGTSTKDPVSSGCSSAYRKGKKSNLDCFSISLCSFWVKQSRLDRSVHGSLIRLFSKWLAQHPVWCSPSRSRSRCNTRSSQCIPCYFRKRPESTGTLG